MQHQLADRPKNNAMNFQAKKGPQETDLLSDFSQPQNTAPTQPVAQNNEKKNAFGFIKRKSDVPNTSNQQISQPQTGGLLDMNFDLIGSGNNNTNDNTNTNLNNNTVQPDMGIDMGLAQPQQNNQGLFDMESLNLQQNQNNMPNNTGINPQDNMGQYHSFNLSALSVTFFIIFYLIFNWVLISDFF